MTDARSMTAWLAVKRARLVRGRWLAMSVLLLAHVACDFLLAASCGEGEVWFLSLMYGVPLSQPSLIAMWLVFAARPLLARGLMVCILSFGMILAVLFGLQFAHDLQRSQLLSWRTFVVVCGLVAAGVSFGTVAFVGARRLLGRPYLVLPGQPTSPQEFQQVKLQQFLRDIGVMCILMAVTRQVLPPYGQLQIVGWEWELINTILVGALASVALAVPMLVICLFVGRANVTLWTLGLTVWTALVAYGMYFEFGRQYLFVAQHGWLNAVLFCIGVNASLCISLATMKSVGFFMTKATPPLAPTV